MNIYIPVTIILVTMLFIVIRLFNRFRIESFQAITFNYLAAALCSFVADYQINIQNSNEFSQCLKAGLPIGLLFIAIFYLMAMVTRNIGVAIASVLSKMSVVIPIVAGVILYNEKLDTLRIAGIAIALLAVYLTSVKRETRSAPADFQKIVLLIVFFIGSGLVDTSIKFVQANLMSPQTENLYIFAMFGSASMFGFIKIAFDYFSKRKPVVFKNIAGGTVLGCVNYFSLYFVLKALQFPGAKSSITFAIINIGVLLTVALFGLLVFREKFSSINYIGFLLAIGAIVILSL